MAEASDFCAAAWEESPATVGLATALSSSSKTSGTSESVSVL